MHATHSPGMKYALPRTRDGGAIVNVASVSGVSRYLTVAAHVASKHAVIGLTRTAALEGSIPPASQVGTNGCHSAVTVVEYRRDRRRGVSINSVTPAPLAPKAGTRARLTCTSSSRRRR